METSNGFRLEEFSLETKSHFDDYVSSFEDFEKSWFCELAFPEFNNRLNYYMANRSKSLRQDCNRLNILMKYQPNFNPNNLSKPCQMYFLVREEDKMAIGMAQIYCGHKHGKNSYVPEVIYEVAPPERGRKYGKVLLNMLLEDKRIDAEWLYFNICKNNEASTGLITSFEAKVVARNDGLDSKTYRLHRK